MALDGAAPRRRRGPRRRHPRPAGRSGRPAGTWRTSPTRSSTARSARTASASTSSTTLDVCPSLRLEGQLHRGPPVQPDVQDPRRPGRGGRGRRLPAARDGAGHVRELRQRAADHAQEAARSASPRWASRSATRSRPENFDLPHPRVRADGDGVLRAAGRRPAVVRVLVRRASATGTRPRHPGRPAPAAGPRRRRAVPLLGRAPPTWSSSSPGAGTSSRASPTAPTTTSPQHAKHSGERLDYFDQATGERYVPHVIEPAAGATRTMVAFLLAAYDEDEVGGETRTVLRLHPRLAPYKVAVLPLSKKDTLTPLAKEVFQLLADRWMCDYDDTQSIGRRYRRQDEIGTPLCRHGRLRIARGPGRHHPRPRHDRAGQRCRSTIWWPTVERAPRLLKHVAGDEGSASSAGRGTPATAVARLGQRREAHAEPSNGASRLGGWPTSTPSITSTAARRWS